MPADDRERERPADEPRAKRPRPAPPARSFFELYRAGAGQWSLDDLDECMTETMVRVVNGGGNTCMWTQNVRDGEAVWTPAGDVFAKGADRGHVVRLQPEFLPEGGRKEPWVAAVEPSADGRAVVVVSLRGRAEHLLATGRIRSYSRADCVPYFDPGEPLARRARDEHVFNLFQGFPLARAGAAPPPTAAELAEFDDVFVGHMRDVICGGHAGMLAYLERYVCHMLTRPAELPGKALAFVSSMEGAGKDTWIDAVKAVLGRALWVDLSPAELGGRFNMAALNRVLVYSPEATPPKDFNRLKADITAPVKRYEPKGREAVQARHFSRYWFTANSDWVVNAGVSNRRFMVFRVSNARVGDRAYFARLREYLARPRARELVWHHFVRRVRLPDGWYPGTDHVDAQCAVAGTILQSKQGRVWAFLARLATGLLDRGDCACGGAGAACPMHCWRAWVPGARYVYRAADLHRAYAGHYQGQGETTFNAAHLGRQLAGFGHRARVVHAAAPGRRGSVRQHSFAPESLLATMGRVLGVPVRDLAALRAIMLEVDGLQE